MKEESSYILHVYRNIKHSKEPEMIVLDKTLSLPFAPTKDISIYDGKESLGDGHGFKNFYWDIMTNGFVASESYMFADNNEWMVKLVDESLELGWKFAYESESITYRQLKCKKKN